MAYGNDELHQGAGPSAGRCVDSGAGQPAAGRCPEAPAVGKATSSAVASRGRHRCSEAPLIRWPILTIGRRGAGGSTTLPTAWERAGGSHIPPLHRGNGGFETGDDGRPSLFNALSGAPLLPWRAAVSIEHARALAADYPGDVDRVHRSVAASARSDRQLANPTTMIGGGHRGAAATSATPATASGFVRDGAAAGHRRLARSPMAPRRQAGAASLAAAESQFGQSRAAAGLKRMTGDRRIPRVDGGGGAGRAVVRVLRLVGGRPGGRRRSAIRARASARYRRSGRGRRAAVARSQTALVWCRNRAI